MQPAPSIPARAGPIWELKRSLIRPYNKQRSPAPSGAGLSLYRNGPLWKRDRDGPRKEDRSPALRPVPGDAYFLNCFRSQSFPSTKRETMKQVT